MTVYIKTRNYSMENVRIHIICSLISNLLTTDKITDWNKLLKAFGTRLQPAQMLQLTNPLPERNGLPNIWEMTFQPLTPIQSVKKPYSHTPYTIYHQFYFAETTPYLTPLPIRIKKIIFEPHGNYLSSHIPATTVAPVNR